MKILVLLSFILINKFCFAQHKVNKSKEIFVCSPCGASCDTIQFDKAGKCPHCGMSLIKKIDKKINNNEKEISICFYLQDNVEILDFAGPLEVFRVAGFKVFTVSKSKDKITSQGCLAIIPDYNIQEAPASNVMIFFGGSHCKPTNDTSVINWIKSRKQNTEYFISVCTGAFILGKAGILDNLTATTYHTQIEELQKALPKTKVLSNVRFVDNGNVISTAGISAGIDGALHFISKIKGVGFARQVADDIEYEYWIPNNGLIINKTK